MANVESEGRGSNPLGSIAVIVLVVATAGGLALAGADGGVVVGGVAAFMLAGVLAFVTQWLAFVPAYLRRTEVFFDLTGSLTYIALALFGLWIGGGSRAQLLALLVGIWAVRLGTFLFIRVRAAGIDRRFVRIKADFWQFLMTWTLQGFWVFGTLAPALAAMTSLRQVPMGGFALAGVLVWLAGFLIEVAADEQKRRFRRDAANDGRFISSGLWAWSQHPNYFGEIVLWIGIALISLPVLQGWQWLTLVSPLFVYILLRYISGIRMLDALADRRWGDDPDYQAYRRTTSMLLPWPPRPA